MTEQIPMRTVRTRGATYLRVEDVVSVLINVGSTEDSDVRLRLTELANNIAKLGETHAN